MSSPKGWQFAVAIVLIVVASSVLLPSHQATAGERLGSGASAWPVPPGWVTLGSLDRSAASGPTVLARAATSLALGAGPARGSAWLCSELQGGSLRCGSSDSAAAPEGATSSHAGTGAAWTPEPAWSDQSVAMDGGGPGPSAWGSAAAWDPTDGEVVLFGGWTGTTPDNSTWVYNGTAWDSLATAPLHTPPALFGESMAWDPVWHYVLMVGGFGVSGFPVNSTWEFQGFGWTNLTPYVGGAGVVGTTANGVGYSSMVYDDALGALVLVDGCLYENCNSVVGQGGPISATWEFTTSWTHVGYGPNLFHGGISYLAYRWNASAAYDRADDELIYFGGDAISGSHVIDEATYVYNGGGGWTNITANTSAYGYPSPRTQASMTWDGQLGVVLLVGGRGATGFLNDSWYFVGGHWFPILSSNSLGLVGPAPGPASNVAGAMPSNSSDVAPVLVGGTCAGSPCFGSSWVFETPPVPEILSASPNPTELGIPVNVQADKVPGTGSGPTVTWSIYVTNLLGGTIEAYSGKVTGVTYSSALVFSHALTYTAAFEFASWAGVTDFYGVQGNAYDPVTVEPALALSPTVTPNPSEVGSGVAFGAGVAGGVSPFAYLWGFGDGSPTSNAATPTHIYPVAGNYTARVNVTDGAGGSHNSTVHVVVDPPLSATAGASVISTDVGKPVIFTAHASNGSLQFTSFSWVFGDGNTSVSQNPSHAFGTVGTFVVRLSVRDTLGATATASLAITVNPFPIATVSASTLTPTVGASVDFAAVPSGGTGPFSYAWNFGDSQTGVGATPTHTFSAAGTYAVTVTVTDAVGASAVTTLKETVASASSGTPSGGSLPGGALVYAAIGVAAAGAGAGALYFVKLRPKNPSQVTKP